MEVNCACLELFLDLGLRLLLSDVNPVVHLLLQLAERGALFLWRLQGEKERKGRYVNLLIKIVKREDRCTCLSQGWLRPCSAVNLFATSTTKRWSMKSLAVKTQNRKLVLRSFSTKKKEKEKKKKKKKKQTFSRNLVPILFGIIIFGLHDLFEYLRYALRVEGWETTQ